MECDLAEERRTVMRTPVLLEARWKSVSGDTYDAHLKNLSVAGCFLETSAQLHIRAPIEVEIVLPDGERLAIWGQVAFNLPEEGIGVYFTEVNEAVRDSLVRFVEQYGRNEPAGEEACDEEGAGG
jgi:hypothetical protein